MQQRIDRAKIVARRRTFGALFGVAVLACASGALGEQAVKQFDPRLYAPSPPPGSSYVRLVDGGLASASVAIGAAPPVSLAPSGRIATAYRVVPGGGRLAITIDGKGRSIAVAPDTFLTVVFRPGSGGSELKTIVDDPGEDNPLLAQLRFYNLVPGCAGALTLANGATVFAGVATDQGVSRTINPVAATLIARCGTRAGMSVKIPAMKAHERYSIFLLGNSAKLRPIGNEDSTETYKGG